RGRHARGCAPSGTSRTCRSRARRRAGRTRAQSRAASPRGRWCRRSRFAPLRGTAKSLRRTFEFRCASSASDGYFESACVLLGLEPKVPRAAGGAELALVPVDGIRFAGEPAFDQLVEVARAGLTGLAGAGLPARTAGIADVREHAVHRSPHPGERLRGRVAVLHDGLACSPGLDVTGEDSVKKRVRVGKRMRELDTVDFAPAP